MTDDIPLDLPDLTIPDPAPTIEESFAAFHAANPHILEALIALIDADRAAGLRYTSIRDAFGELRRRGARTTGKPYLLNNNHTALYGRAIVEARPDLEPMLRLRERRAA